MIINFLVFLFIIIGLSFFLLIPYYQKIGEKIYNYINKKDEEEGVDYDERQ